MEEERSGECPTGGQNCTGEQGLLQHHWCLGCEGRGRWEGVRGGEVGGCEEGEGGVKREGMEGRTTV